MRGYLIVFLYAYTSMVQSLYLSFRFPTLNYIKTPKLRVTGLCEKNSPVTCEFPAQRVSNAMNASI